MSHWFVDKIRSKCIYRDDYYDYYDAYTLHKSDLEELITTNKEKISTEDVAEALKFFILEHDSSSIRTLLEHNLPITPAIIQHFLAICCKNRDEDEHDIYCANSLAVNTLQLLNTESVSILMETKNRKLQNLAIKAIKESKQENIVNIANESGLTFTEIAIINNDYRLATELVNIGANLNRTLALGGPQLINYLHPTFFCSRNHNDAKLQRLLLKVNDEKFINKEFEDLFNDICNKKFSNTALERIAKLPLFKERLFTYIESLAPSLIKETCEKAITQGEPLNTLFNTPRGHGWRNPNASHGHMRKILQKLAALDSTKKSTPLSVEKNQQIPSTPINFFAPKSEDLSPPDKETTSESRMSYTAT